MALVALALIFALYAGAAALLVGWVLNIVAILGMLDGAVTALLAARLVGVFVAPLGGVLGLFA